MSKTKVCFKCGARKPRHAFYRHPQMSDGLLGKCKACTKRDVTIRAIEKWKEIAAYRAAYFKRPDKKHLIEKNRASWRRRNPGKRRAHQKVADAISSGRLTRQPCEKCGEKKTEAHHDDYRRPLEVRWLCFVCHRRRHGQFRHRPKNI